MNNVKVFICCLLASCSLVGCIREGSCSSSLLSSTTKVRFSYTDHQNNEVLDKYVHSAILFVYNQEEELVKTFSLKKEDIINPEAVALDLPLDGEYTVVCWGNVGECSYVKNGDNLSQARIETVGFQSAVSNQESTDALYYGALKYNFVNTRIDAGGRNLTIPLTSKHIKLQLELKGLPRISLPKVEITNLVSQYNFKGLAVSDADQTYIPRVYYNEEERAYSANLNVFKLKDLANTQILIYPNDASSLCNLNLKSLVDKYYPTIDYTSDKEVNLAFTVEFTDLSVVISIPDWNLSDTGGSIS